MHVGLLLQVGGDAGSNRSPTDFILEDAEVITSKNHNGHSFKKYLVSFCGETFSSSGNLIFLNFMTSLPVCLSSYPINCCFSPCFR